jgi:ribosome-associated heat shock protein Hsp15
MDRVRVDKWLWAARFFKTRSLAAQAIESGKVRVEGETVKPAKEVRAGQTLEVRTPGGQFTVLINLVSDHRGNAAAAQLLYEETPESCKAREEEAARRKHFAEPAEAIYARPTKRDRRDLERFRGG